MAFRPAIFDRHVSAFDVADLAQASAKCNQEGAVSCQRCTVEEADDRHRRLLRTRRKRRAATAPPSAAINSRRPMITGTYPAGACLAQGTIPCREPATALPAP